MSDTLSGDLPVQAGFFIALAILGLFLSWRVVRMSKPVRAFLAGRNWTEALIDFVLLPFAVYGAGLMVDTILTWMMVPEWRDLVATVTRLLITLAVSSGIARLIGCGWSRKTRIASQKGTT